MRRVFLKFLLVWLSFVPVAGKAVLFYSTGDPAYNTSAPTGDLEGSGWQFQGEFRQYLGTPISAHFFITAKHFGGEVGENFYFDGQAYSIINKITDSSSDLVLYEVDGTFSRYAPLYATSDELGKGLVVFGRGVDRGVAITNTITFDPPGSKPPVMEVVTNGWEWGAYNYTQRWGENTVAGYVDYAALGDQKLLRVEFNNEAGINECMMADKDSGGGVFVEDGGVWKLAGINYAIGPGWTYSFSPDGSDPFNASILDFSGDNALYVKQWSGDEYVWNLVPSSHKSSFYSTRISSCYEWITNNIPDFDADVDGLPDWWETLHGETEAGEDPDGDGFTNYEEWLADTLPNDSNSFLRVVDYSSATSLVFNSSANRKYQIEYRTDLSNTNELWQTEVDWFDGSHPQTVRSVSTPTSNRFYRVRVKLR